jgi:hypothetical protein
LEHSKLKKFAQIFAKLTVIYANSNLQRETEEVIVGIVELLMEPTEYTELYKAVVKAFIEYKIPLQLLLYTSKFLPRNPKLAKVEGEEVGGFYYRNDRGGRSTIIGINDHGNNAGKELVEIMINEVREAAKAKHLQQRNENNETKLKFQQRG